VRRQRGRSRTLGAVRCAVTLLVAIAWTAGMPGIVDGDTDQRAARASGDADAPRAGATVGAGRNVAAGEIARQLAALTAGLPACEASRAHCLGIQLHVTVDAAGSVIAKPEWVAAQLAAANRHFASIDAGFTVVGADALPAGAGRVATRAERDAVSEGRLTGKVIHVFITGRLDDVDVEGGVIRGVTWHRRGSERKYIILSTAAPDRVLAHELGHVFGLPHSTYAVSIMNKTERAAPPIEARTFADPEVAAMRPVLARLLRDHVIADIER
jgi:matrixin